ncbi:fanconi-associated nuclease 1-like [Asterias amurensis]|uniref:fanconi-associated nuclease 1-like n=1 Tax=Asterias amurensis TaxID=7602 RepID=UPI003AB1D960
MASKSPKGKGSKTTRKQTGITQSAASSNTFVASPTKSPISRKSPQTPNSKSPTGTAKYSPNFSRKKRKKLFKELSAATVVKSEDALPVEVGSKNTIESFFSRVKPQKFVPCPICQEQVPLSAINQHLDKGCVDTTTKDEEDFVQNPKRVKRRRTKSEKTKDNAVRKETVDHCASARKIAEVKSDLKDRRTRLMLKKKIESHSLYKSTSEASNSDNLHESSTNGKRLCHENKQLSSPSLKSMVQSKYFKTADTSEQNSEISSTPKLRQNLFVKSPEEKLSKKCNSSASLTKDEGISLERKLSSASTCSTVLLSQSQECKEEVFMMYSNSFIPSSQETSNSDVFCDTSPDFSHQSSSFSKLMRRNVSYTSMASTDGGEINETPGTTDTSSGIGSQSSYNSGVSIQPEDLPSTSGQATCEEFIQAEEFSALNWEDDDRHIPTSITNAAESSKLMSRVSKSVLSSSILETIPLRGTSVNNPQKDTPTKKFNSTKSPLRTPSPKKGTPPKTSREARTHSPERSKKGTPSKSRATTPSIRSPLKTTPSKTSSPARSPTTSPWKYKDPYFLVNFKLILKTVLGIEDDRSLFNDQDMLFVESFRQLSAPAQQLYVRLFQRKHAWLRVAKLDYQRIAEDLSPVVDELHQAGLTQTEQDLDDFESSLNLCAAPDLKTLAKTLRLSTPSSGQTKQDLVEALLKHGREQRSIFAVSMEEVLKKKAKKMLGSCIRLSNEPRVIFSRILLLFSLTTDLEEEDKANGGMSQLQTLLLSNMGRVIYPTYKVLRTVKIFKTREDLLRYETALHYETDIATAMSTNDFETAYQLQQTAIETYQQIRKTPTILNHDLSLPVFLRRFTASWTYTRIMYTGVEILQKMRRYPDAVDVLQRLLDQTNYCTASRGRWWERLALNLDQHLKRSEQALDVIKDGLEDSFVRTGHRLALQVRAQKILKSSSYKKKKTQPQEFTFDQIREMPRVTIEGQILPYQAPGIKNTFVREWTGGKKQDGDLAICSVEEVALHHYKSLGYEEGVHGEGSTFTTLAFLLFWDIIFMDGIPDAFCYPYQSAPLDIRSDDFFANRQDVIERRLTELREADEEGLLKRLGSSWEEYNGEQCTGVKWDLFNDLDHAKSLLVCFGGQFIAAVAERILQDHRHCRGGMPDLTMWSPESGKFKLVEVKGPGDRLAQKQILWIDFFLSLGVEAEVCHVTAVGSKRRKLLRTSSRDSEASTM